jgi:hypothetical protein
MRYILYHGEQGEIVIRLEGDDDPNARENLICDRSLRLFGLVIRTDFKFRSRLMQG